MTHLKISRISSWPWLMLSKIKICQTVFFRKLSICDILPNSKIAQNLSQKVKKKKISSNRDSPLLINYENWCYHGFHGRFSSNLESKSRFHNLGRELNCANCFLFKHPLMKRHAWKQDWIRTLLPVVYRPFLAYFIIMLKHKFVWNYRYV